MGELIDKLIAIRMGYEEASARPEAAAAASEVISVIRGVDRLECRITTLELALSEISALPGERLDEANYIAVAALNKDKG